MQIFTVFRNSYPTRNHSFLSPYRLQTNGCTEASQKSLKIVQENSLLRGEVEWDEEVNTACTAYNIFQMTTAMSQHFSLCLEEMNIFLLQLTYCNLNYTILETSLHYYEEMLRSLHVSCNKSQESKRQTTY